MLFQSYEVVKLDLWSNYKRKMCYNLYGDIMNSLKLNHISKKDFFKLKEEDVMFITNPGRMGDEDGSTFIIKDGDNYLLYRVSGWMSRNHDIDLEDMEKVFPMWIDAWKNSINEKYEGKYKYYYMGFGNGLCVDKSISDIFDKNLELELSGKEEDRYGLIFRLWDKVAIKTINELNGKITKKS